MEEKDQRRSRWERKTNHRKQERDRYEKHSSGEKNNNEKKNVSRQIFSVVS